MKVQGCFMKKVSSIGSLVKKTYRTYSGELLQLLQVRGFTDLRPSFLEVLLFICEHDGPTIKEIGHGCGLKKHHAIGDLFLTSK